MITIVQSNGRNVGPSLQRCALRVDEMNVGGMVSGTVNLGVERFDGNSLRLHDDLLIVWRGLAAVRASCDALACIGVL